MHFVICMFVAAVCFATCILFKEVMHKISIHLIRTLGCATFAYALSILVKKCGEWFGWWSGSAKYIRGNFLWLFVIVLVVVNVIVFLMNKKEKQAN